MIISKLSATNFASYESLEFDYDNLGLTLISGPTKAGKSTILDAVCWGLYGITSKDLNADDVKSWFGSGKTQVNIEVSIASDKIFITRIRGFRPTENDLYYSIKHNDGQWSPQTRGKDAKDTQKQINQKLGVDANLYIAASYIHQFTSDQFFSATARERREVLERIADLSLPATLGDRASQARKNANKELEMLLQQKSKLDGNLETLTLLLSTHKIKQENWNEKQKTEIYKASQLSETYISDKQDKIYLLVEQLEELNKIIQEPESFDNRLSQIKEQLKSLEIAELELKKKDKSLAMLSAEQETLKRQLIKFKDNMPEQCPTCLGPTDNAHRFEHVEKLKIDLKDLELEIEPLRTEVNDLVLAVSVKTKLHDAYQKCTQDSLNNERLIEKFEILKKQAFVLKEETNQHLATVDKLKNQENPHDQTIIETENQLDQVKDSLVIENQFIQDIKHLISSLTWLYDKSSELRGILLQNVITQINTSTNDILERHFDATIRIQLSMNDGDQLEVNIINEGYACKYAQLSGGERAMLKLAYGISYIRAAENKAATKFNALMLDESFNGLDAGLKVKAFTLLQELEKDYKSIIVIDHEESLKQLFTRVFKVEKQGAFSQITETV